MVCEQCIPSQSWTDLMPCCRSWFLWMLIYLKNFHVRAARSIPVTATAHEVPLPPPLTGHAWDPKHKLAKVIPALLWLSWHRLQWLLCGSLMGSDILLSVNIKWMFVTSMVNYHYWHCNYVWLHLGWKLKNRPKEATQLLSSSFMGWKASFKNTGFSSSQCLSDFLKQIVDPW